MGGEHVGDFRNADGDAILRSGLRKLMRIARIARAESLYGAAVSAQTCKLATLSMRLVFIRTISMIE